MFTISDTIDKEKLTSLFGAQILHYQSELGLSDNDLKNRLKKSKVHLKDLNRLTMTEYCIYLTALGVDPVKAIENVFEDYHDGQGF